jgi:hypothetical protein
MAGKARVVEARTPAHSSVLRECMVMVVVIFNIVGRVEEKECAIRSTNKPERNVLGYFQKGMIVSRDFAMGCSIIRRYKTTGVPYI